MKEARGGAEKWQERHLPSDAKSQFKDDVVPRVRQLIGSLDPWVQLTPEHVQKVLNHVYGDGKYQASKNDVFFNLVCRRLTYYLFFLILLPS
jgi:hypothetical protein